MYLLRELHKETLLKKPELGSNPFSKEESTSEYNNESINSLVKKGSDEYTSPLPPAEKLDSRGTSFVIRSWLDSGGNIGRVEPYVVRWLQEYGESQEAIFIIRPWLISGGSRELVELFVVHWLERYGDTQEANFLIVSRLESGGSRELVEPFIDEWLKRFTA